MKSSFFLPMAAVALLASCSSDMDLAQSGEKFEGKVTLSAPAYEYEDGTRTTLTSSTSGISFAWDDDETIGIFPIAPTTNAQAYQKLNGGSGNGTKSSFDGAGWALLRGNTYAAYYPFQDLKSTDTYKSIPIDMTGQTQNGNGSLAHIGAGYDYMYATASVPQSGDVNFEFNHITSIVKLELTIPVPAQWESVTMSSDDEVFITKATFNASTGSITSVAKSSSIVLKLNNINTTYANQKVELYFATLPTTTDDLTIMVRTSSNNCYSATLGGKSFKAGKAHLLASSLVAPVITSGDGVENGHEYVDLGLPSGLKWATMNVGATSPEDYGNYYAWGETRGYGEADETNLINYNYNANLSYIKVRYDWSTYKWCTGQSPTNITKYCTSGIFADNKTTLDPEDDAASVNWRGAWRMPTQEDFEELENNCCKVQICYQNGYRNGYNDTKVYGVAFFKPSSSSDKGQYFDGKKIIGSYPLSKPHIFFPSAGYYVEGTTKEASSVGVYWSSSLESSAHSDAYKLTFSNLTYYSSSSGRRDGCSVRAVCEK